MYSDSMQIRLKHIYSAARTGGVRKGEWNFSPITQLHALRA